MSSNVALARLKKELGMLYHDPPPGISAWEREESKFEIDAVVQGAQGTPYADGCFRLRLVMPPRYPFEPPKVHFVTPIYHPNIDSAGRICLDILNMPPKGAWKPSLNISTVLSSIQLLMSHPNADDGLMLDITNQYIHNFAQFQRDAVEHTKRHAGAEKPAPPPAQNALVADSRSAASSAEPPSAPAPAASATSISSMMDQRGAQPQTVSLQMAAAASDREATKRQRME
uniref:E2 ubiquitin-conjugating enzyme n=1 Tax=Calcidiscus leptoporus TaxID=127549 RepID=A0A7S0JCU1_9EUKA